MRKIGIGSLPYFDLDNAPQGLEKMKSHGFDCCDFQLFLNTENNPLFTSPTAEAETILRRIRTQAQAVGVEFYQSHGPWRWPAHDGSERERAERFDVMSRSLCFASVLGCPNLVLHLMMPFGGECEPDSALMHEINLDFFSRLSEKAKHYGTVICLENMPMPAISLATPKQILDLVREINSPYLRVCLDTGHCAIFGQPDDAVRLIGADFLYALHIHDNDGFRDLHQFPGQGIIRWDDFKKSLDETHINIPVNLELHLDSSLPVAEYDTRLRSAASLARSFS